jgi:hypothetical protein
VDFRVASHCTHSDDSDNYGYNDCVLGHCRAAGLPIDPDNIARVRGEAYTEFLRDACALLKRHGLTRRVSLHQDGFRSPRFLMRRLAYPGLISFPWKQWIDEGLFDAATLRSYAQPFAALQQDPVSVEMIDYCAERGIPLYNQRYLYPGHVDSMPFPEMYERTRRDERFAGFCMYELVNYMNLDEAGQWQFTQDEAKRWIITIANEHRGQLAAVAS